MSSAGFIHEVFASFQGEGTHVGRMHVFVRTGGCSLRCRFCDTPQALVTRPKARLERLDRSSVWVDNPVSAEAIAEFVDQLDPERRYWVSLTGGEPLEQPDYLEALAAVLNRRLYLETAGVHSEAMQRVKDRVQCVAFDLKLDSVAGEGDRRKDHAAFLRACRGVERMAKAIVSDRVDFREFESLVRLVAAEDPSIPLILQPETPRDGGPPQMSWSILAALYRKGLEHLEEVRVIPQTHKFLDLP